MEENEKPFPCKVNECTQSFSTEDHLNVHTKKHLLNLELPGKHAHFIDQTPTPTRFIRNCEEVGLFEELKNVNPFEETFRRAVEDNSIHSVNDNTDETPSRFSTALRESSLSLNEDIMNPDDTLHTPQIFPNYLTSRSSLEPSHKRHKLAKLSITTPSAASNDIKEEKSKHSTSVIVANPAKVSQETRKLVESKLAQPKLPISILPRPRNELDPVLIIIPVVSQPAQIIQVEEKKTNPVKDKLKKLLLSNKRDKGIELCETGPQTSSGSPESQKLTNNHNYNHIDADIEHQDPGKSRAQQERWKAAAKRYRTKVKESQEFLRRKNKDLEAENLRLKHEVINLRKILKMHKDCSVTRGIATPMDVKNVINPGTRVREADKVYILLNNNDKK